jgi:rSAM/selenodomain-associated transferase 2
LQKNRNANKLISVIIPALNEAPVIVETIRRAAMGRDTEIIVVDGGSRDATVATARSRNVRVMSAPAGRGRQMNAGAAAARGDLLLFLHADTLLPPGYDLLVRRTLAAPGTAAGAFRLRVDAHTASVRFIERVANFRSRVLQMPYGDQGLFLRRRIFRQLGGFADTPIMEDFDLVRRLRPRGRIVTVSLPVVTSARRWLRLGVLKTWLINQAVVLAFYAGLPRDRIAAWYRGRTKAEPGRQRTR